MSEINTTASTAHKQAASDHEACAKHHTNAAQSHDSNKVGEAKENAKHAMTSSDKAAKQTATACGCSTH